MYSKDTCDNIFSGLFEARCSTNASLWGAGEKSTRARKKAVEGHHDISFELLQLIGWLSHPPAIY